jgi:thiol-disulfide isomerase/thioredoxin
MRILPTLLALIALSCGPDPGAQEGRTAPPLRGQLLNGAELDDDALAGKVVVVAFWASWCGPCREEAPALRALAEQYGDRIHLLSINAGEPLAMARAAAAEIGVAGTVVLDVDGALQGAFEVTAIPLLLVIDGSGVIRYRGHALPSDIHRLLDGLTGS